MSDELKDLAEAKRVVSLLKGDVALLKHAVYVAVALYVILAAAFVAVLFG